MKALSKEWLIEPKMWLDIFSNMDIGIGIYEEVNEGKDFVVKYFNEAAEEIVALKPEEYMDKSIKEIFPEIENTNFFQAIKEVYTTGVGYKLPASYYEDHRISLWKSNYISKLPSGHIASIFYDITASTELGTQLKKAEMDLKNELERYKNLFENAQEIVYIRDLEGKIISINKACERILGYKVEELIGANIRSIVHKDEYKYLEGEHILKSLDKDSKYSSEIRFITLEGSEKILEVTRCLYKKGSVYELQAIARDITERKEEERKVKYISFHDRLTGLNNRNYFEEKLNKLVEDKVYPLSVIMGDVNSLKLVNDAFGHEEGDRLLVEIGRILKKSSLEHSLVARIAGDEFIIITPFIKDSETLAIIKSIKEECENSSLSPIKPSIALGYAIMESLEENIHDIIKEAE